jgi:hypothetical protein
LSRFTLEEISLIAELEESEAEKILNVLIKENFLKKQNDIYIYIEEKKSPQNRLPIMFQFHQPEEIDMIIKCFCAGITTDKGAFLLGISNTTLQNFNIYFRKIIYEKQLKKLEKYFEQNPKIAKVRTFYEIPVCFYLYDEELFVTEKPLTSKGLKPHTKQENLKIKVLYSRLRRSINHSKMKKLMPYHVAEHLWKYGKGFEQLTNELKLILFA